MLMRHALMALLGSALIPVVANAATGASVFAVRVSYKAADFCVSTSLSQVTNALVRVTCQGNQFVSIEPRAGRPFVGTHGGAYRFAFSQRSGFSGGNVDFGQSVSALEAAIGQGTITALRVLDLSERDERLELLVSF